MFIMDPQSEILKPHQSTHRKNWVYAIPDLAMAASFLVRAGDFHFGNGVELVTSAFFITCFRPTLHSMS
ncbi:MAG: hypothetical protein KR126chlam5_00602 [Candidatus Anoxychlamydiales bacterium]|nr:hypothetical protein [Candidatus Anoxychlamydiales bacterium]